MKNIIIRVFFMLVVSLKLAAIYPSSVPTSPHLLTLVKDNCKKAARIVLEQNKEHIKSFVDCHKAEPCSVKSLRLSAMRRFREKGCRADVNQRSLAQLISWEVKRLKSNQ